MSVQSKDNTVTFLGVGDIGSDWWRVNPPQEIFRHVQPVISAADIAFGQQEGLWTETDDSHADIMR